MLKVFLYFIVIFMFISCGDSKPDKLVVDYSFSVDSTKLPLNQTTQIRVSANYDDGSTKDVTNEMIYSSSDEDVATVDESGLVRTYSKNAQVTISFQTKAKLTNLEPIYKSSIVFDVMQLHLKSINILENDMDILIGQSKQLSAEGIYEEDVTLDITQTSTWSSSDANIASVDKGLVKAISIGSVEIKVTQDDISSEVINIDVLKPLYNSIIIEAPKTELYAQQSIELVLKGVQDNNETVILGNDSALWSSSNNKVLEVDKNGTVKALKIGSAVINATLIADNTFSSSIDLNVTKDKYVELYKDNKLVEFPYTSINEYKDKIPETLPTFTLVAVGRDFTFNNVIVTDINGQILADSVAYFDGLTSQSIVLKDKNITFTLKHNNSQDALNYLFNIDDEAKSLFSAKFLKVDP